MLLGVLPLHRSVRLDDGRGVFLCEEALETWAHDPHLQTPVLLAHDASRLVGWCTRVKFTKPKAMLYGELDGGPPEARTTARLASRAGHQVVRGNGSMGRGRRGHVQ